MDQEVSQGQRPGAAGVHGADPSSQCLADRSPKVGAGAWSRVADRVLVLRLGDRTLL